MERWGGGGEGRKKGPCDCILRQPLKVLWHSTLRAYFPCTIAATRVAQPPKHMALALHAICLVFAEEEWRPRWGGGRAAASPTCPGPAWLKRSARSLRQTLTTHFSQHFHRRGEGHRPAAPFPAVPFRPQCRSARAILHCGARAAGPPSRRDRREPGRRTCARGLSLSMPLWSAPPRLPDFAASLDGLTAPSFPAEKSSTMRLCVVTLMLVGAVAAATPVSGGRRA